MVNIVTGKIHSGKTTRVLQEYLSSQKGDGFVSLKVLEDGHVRRFEAMRLSTMESHVLCYHQLHDHCDGVVRDQIGDYRFLDETLSWMEHAVQEMISNQVSPIYLDEIGFLELQGKGLASILRQLVEQNVDLVLSVRTEFAANVITTFHLQDVHTTSL